MTFQIVKNTFYFLICVASVGSNSLLIAILLRFEHLRTTTNLFVLNLAFCDVATVLLSIPFTVAVEESASYPFGELGCKVLMPSATAAFNSAAFTLLAIAIDRFYAIMFPMRARLQSCKMKSLAVCFLHGVSVLSVIPFAIHQRLIQEGNHYKCAEDWPNGNSRIYTLVLFCIQYAIPLTVIAVLYSISWNQIRKKNKVIIKMQELQQKGTCHFSRSQSWDVAMKKSETYSFLMGDTSKDSEKQVNQSASSYSFMSSQLEAVVEAIGNNSVKGAEERQDDENRRDETGRPEEEQMLMMKIHTKKQMESGQQMGNDCIHEDQKEACQNGVGKQTTRGKQTSLKDDREDYQRKRAVDDGEKGLHVKDRKSASSHLKLRRSLTFTSKYPWLKSDCLSKRMRRSKRRWKNRLEKQKHSISEAQESESTQTAVRQDNWKGEYFNGGKNEGDIPEGTGNADFSSLPADKETATILQSKNTGSMHAVKRGNSQTEPASSALCKSFDRNASIMGHSISSPALGTTSQGNPRRQSSQNSLLKGGSSMETRLSRISQIAVQAKQKVSQALTTSSSENMCSASVKRMRQTRRTLRMFTCVVVVFAVCILPNQVTWIWMAFNGAHLNHVLYTVFYFLTYTNSVINPWIYGAVNPSFRKAYRKVFCCQSNLKRARNTPMRRSSSKLTYPCASKGELTSPIRKQMQNKQSLSLINKNE